MENINNATPKTCPVCGCILEDGHTAMGTVCGEPELFCDTCAGNYTMCDDCGAVIPEDEAIETADGDTICQNCYDDGYFTCESCDEVHRTADMIIVNRGHRSEYYVCEDCAEQGYYRCDDCGDYFTYAYIAMDDSSTFICDDCADDWAVCSDCGEVIRTDDAYMGDDDEWYCASCIADHQGSASVHGYSYKPWPEIHRIPGELENAPTYGVELEVDDGDDVNDLADELDSMGEPIYCKHDGSLDDGLEIVTHPATLRYHLERMDWDGITKACKNGDFRSHDTNTCGLHVHVGRAGRRDTFGAAMAVLCCALQDELTTFSRRRPSALQRWSAWNWTKAAVDLDVEDDKLLDQIKALYADSIGRGRYQAVNLQNRGTIELRIFRGTLRSDTIRAALELVDALVCYADTHNVCQCARATWSDLAAEFTGRELLEYCRARGLWTPDDAAESTPA